MQQMNRALIDALALSWWYRPKPGRADFIILLFHLSMKQWYALVTGLR